MMIMKKLYYLKINLLQLSINKEKHELQTESEEREKNARKNLYIYNYFSIVKIKTAKRD